MMALTMEQQGNLFHALGRSKSSTTVLLNVNII